MSEKFENELVSLLEMRFSDDPCNHQKMYSNFFASNKKELMDPLIWQEIRTIASEELEYKAKFGLPNLVDNFLDELHLSYTIWSSLISNI